MPRGARARLRRRARDDAGRDGGSRRTPRGISRRRPPRRHGAGWRRTPTGGAAPRALWPDVRSIVMLGMSYAPETNPLDALDHPTRGTISVYAQGKDYHDILKGKLKQLAARLAADERRRCESVRRYGAGDGEAARRRGRPRLAGQEHHAGVARARLVAVPRRHLHDRRAAARRRRRTTTAAAAAAASTCARRRRSRRPISSMRAAASPTCRSSTRGTSRPSSAAPWATACSAATTASPCARGTSSPGRNEPASPPCTTSSRSGTTWPSTAGRPVTGRAGEGAARPVALRFGSLRCQTGGGATSHPEGGHVTTPQAPGGHGIEEAGWRISAARMRNTPCLTRTSLKPTSATTNCTRPARPAPDAVRSSSPARMAPPRQRPVDTRDLPRKPLAPTAGAAEPAALARSYSGVSPFARPWMKSIASRVAW